MDEIIIPQPSDDLIEDIKRTVAYHYGFMPSDEVLLRIEGGLRNNYAALHRENIIREIVAMKISDDMQTYRDKLGSLEFEKIWMEKSIFRYLTYASMCYRAGIPAGTISLCRTAMEAGIRERLAEKLAQRDTTNQHDLAEKTLAQAQRLRNKLLKDLIKMASKEGILNEHDVEESFKTLKFENQESRKILDKFIHGDIVWMVDFVQSRKGDTKVIGAKNRLEEVKIIAEMEVDYVAVEVLRATDHIAALLYYG